MAVRPPQRGLETLSLALRLLRLQPDPYGHEEIDADKLKFGEDLRICGRYQSCNVRGLRPAATFLGKVRMSSTHFIQFHLFLFYSVPSFFYLIQK